MAISHLTIFPFSEEKNPFLGCPMVIAHLAVGCPSCQRLPDHLCRCRCPSSCFLNVFLGCLWSPILPTVAHLDPTQTLKLCGRLSKLSRLANPSLARLCFKLGFVFAKSTINAAHPRYVGQFFGCLGRLKFLIL